MVQDLKRLGRRLQEGCQSNQSSWSLGNMASRTRLGVLMRTALYHSSSHCRQDLAGERSLYFRNIPHLLTWWCLSTSSAPSWVWSEDASRLSITWEWRGRGAKYPAVSSMVHTRLQHLLRSQGVPQLAHRSHPLYTASFERPSCEDPPPTLCGVSENTPSFPSHSALRTAG